MLLLSDAEVIEAAKRSCGRSAAVVHLEMKRGLNSLATIVSTAPFVAFAGTILGIVDSFQGCGSSKAACMAATFAGLSQAFVPTAPGFLAAVPALWFHHYLSGEMEALNREMENATLELMNNLAIYLGRRNRISS